MNPWLPSLALCVATVVAAPAHGAQSSGCVTLTANLDVTADIVICPGVYVLEDPEGDGVIRVLASNVTIEMTGVDLSGSLASGFGVRADGVDGVTIRGATIGGYRAAVYLSNGAGHRIESCELSHNRKRPVTHTAADFLQVWPDLPGQLAADQIGNGVLLSNVANSVVRRIRATDQQNGIGLFQCTNCEISENVCDGNEGWGIHVHRSSFNTIAANSADDNFNKVSTYCHQVQQDGCDTAALLLIKDSNDNLVIGNSLRNSGDGVFSAAQESATHWGADRNRYVSNDCSFSKHIGIESTFSVQNELVGNVASDCGRYGIWLGYSIDVLVRRNVIRNNAFAGISNESVLRAVYEENDVSDNQVGVELRQGTFPFFHQDSRDHVFLHNLVRSNANVGFSLTDTHEVTIFENTIASNAAGNVRLAASKVADLQGPFVATHNNLLGAGSIPWNVDNQQKAPFVLTDNWWGTTDEHAIAASILGIAQYAVIPPHRVPRLEITFLLNGGGPYVLKRVVNERADDATDTSDGSSPRGNAQDELWLGRASATPGSARFVAGLRFRDIHLPSDATILDARLVLPTDGPHAELLNLRVFGEALDYASSFESGALPATRARTNASVGWRIDEPWTASGWATSPDLTPVLLEILAQPFWVGGNALALLIDDKGTSAGFRKAWAFDREGYATLAGTPKEFRHYRKHRFAKLEVEYADGNATMAVERELGDGSDDADFCIGCNEVHVGKLGSSLTGGFRFPQVPIPKTAAISRSLVWLPTDGPYATPIQLRAFGELVDFAPPYFGANLPAIRPKTAQFVDWPIASPWTFLEWHATPDLTPVVEEVIAQPGWLSGYPIAFDLADDGSTTHRRVWAFDRDPRVTPVDFPEIGPTPFVPFATQPIGW